MTFKGKITPPDKSLCHRSVTNIIQYQPEHQHPEELYRHRTLHIPKSKTKFHLFEMHKQEFIDAFGEEVEFREAEKASRIILARTIDLSDGSTWEEAAKWLLEKSIIFMRLAKAIDK